MKIRKPHYRPGEHLVQCDVCGFTYYSSETKKRWDGMIVCEKDWEPRHPQDFVRAHPDDISVKDARPPNYVFIGKNDVTPDDL